MTRPAILILATLALAACASRRDADLFGGIAQSGVITREAPHGKVHP